MKDTLNRIVRKDIPNIKKKNINDLGIHINFNESNMLNATAIIIGPKDSLYENGLLLFSIEFPKNYPYIPPKIKYIKNNSIRIHPNFYVNGKVCLSILGTWSGPGWCSTMDICDIFISMVSLLDLNPISHEPGYENEKGPKNEVYNMIVEHDNFKTGMLQNGNLVSSETLLGEYDSFKDIIREHFKEAKPRILERCIKLQEKHPKRMECKLGTYHISEVVDYASMNERMKHALFSL